MKAPWRERFGVWLERFAIARLLLSRYSHEFQGRRHYVNRISGTFIDREAGR